MPENGNLLHHSYPVTAVDMNDTRSFAGGEAAGYRIHLQGLRSIGRSPAQKGFQGQRGKMLL